MAANKASSDWERLVNTVELPPIIEIKESVVQKGEPGAFAKSFIRKDTRFGPYKGEIIQPGDKAFIDYRFAWEVSEKKGKSLKFTISAIDPLASNWMRHVNNARFYEEQNILSVQDGYSIYYVAMKDIPKGSELLTWFDPKLLKRTQRRQAKPERKNLGYTIELVKDKSFEPEIMETKRFRKKKVLSDMIALDDNPLAMTRTLQSLPKIPCTQRQLGNMAFPLAHSLKKKRGRPFKSEQSREKAERKKLKNQLQAADPPTSNLLSSGDTNVKTEHPQPTALSPKPSGPTPESLRPHDHLMEVLQAAPHNPVSITPGNLYKTHIPLSNSPFPTNSPKKRKNSRKKLGSLPTPGQVLVKKNKPKGLHDIYELDRKTIDDLNLLRHFNPVCILSEKSGCTSVDDHDESYTLTGITLQAECDDMCQCLDKLKAMSTNHKPSATNGYSIRFTLLPEHRTMLEGKIAYKCDICDGMYNHAYSLKRHYLSVHVNHRYLLRDDIVSCQIETFAKGIVLPDSVHPAAPYPTFMTVNISSMMPPSNSTTSILKPTEKAGSKLVDNKDSSSSGESSNLLCREDINSNKESSNIINNFNSIPEKSQTVPRLAQLAKACIASSNNLLPPSQQIQKDDVRGVPDSRSIKLENVSEESDLRPNQGEIVQNHDCSYNASEQDIGNKALVEQKMDQVSVNDGQNLPEVKTEHNSEASAKLHSVETASSAAEESDADFVIEKNVSSSQEEEEEETSLKSVNCKSLEDRIKSEIIESSDKSESIAKPLTVKPPTHDKEGAFHFIESITSPQPKRALQNLKSVEECCDSQAEICKTEEGKDETDSGVSLENVNKTLGIAQKTESIEGIQMLSETESSKPVEKNSVANTQEPVGLNLTPQSSTNSEPDVTASSSAEDVSGHVLSSASSMSLGEEERPLEIVTTLTPTSRSESAAGNNSLTTTQQAVLSTNTPTTVQYPSTTTLSTISQPLQSTTPAFINQPSLPTNMATPRMPGSQMLLLTNILLPVNSSAGNSHPPSSATTQSVTSPTCSTLPAPSTITSPSTASIPSFQPPLNHTDSQPRPAVPLVLISQVPQGVAPNMFLKTPQGLRTLQTLQSSLSAVTNVARLNGPMNPQPIVSGCVHPNLPINPLSMGVRPPQVNIPIIPSLCTNAGTDSPNTQSISPSTGTTRPPLLYVPVPSSYASVATTSPNKPNISLSPFARATHPNLQISSLPMAASASYPYIPLNVCPNTPTLSVPTTCSMAPGINIPMMSWPMGVRPPSLNVPISIQMGMRMPNFPNASMSMGFTASNVATTSLPMNVSIPNASTTTLLSSSSSLSPTFNNQPAQSAPPPGHNGQPNPAVSSPISAYPFTTIIKTLATPSQPITSLSQLKIPVVSTLTHKPSDNTPPEVNTPAVDTPTTPPKDMFRCHMCVLVFETMEQLKHHIRNDPHRFKGGIKQYACLQCSMRFSSKNNLARHNLLNHTETKDYPFRCSTCGKGFSTENYLKMHARFHLGKSFPCKYGCQEVYFPNAAQLVKHLRTVHAGLDLQEYRRIHKIKRPPRRRKEHADLDPSAPGVGSSDVKHTVGVGISSQTQSQASTVVGISGTSVTLPGISTSTITSQQPLQSDSSVPMSHGLTEPAQVKKGRPKGSKNMFKNGQPILPSTNLPFHTPLTIAIPPSTSTVVNQRLNVANQNGARRKVRFRCKICPKKFTTHLRLMQHRSRKHKLDQSVQEYLHIMLGNSDDVDSEPDDTKFSPPASPQTFFSNVNRRGHENFTQFIEGGGESLKSPIRKYISVRGYTSISSSPHITPDTKEGLDTKCWASFNFPPAFKYNPDSTVFYSCKREKNLSKSVKVEPHADADVCMEEAKPKGVSGCGTETQSLAKDDNQNGESVLTPRSEKGSNGNGTKDVEIASKITEESCDVYQVKAKVVSVIESPKETSGSEPLPNEIDKETSGLCDNMPESSHGPKDGTEVPSNTSSEILQETTDKDNSNVESNASKTDLLSKDKLVSVHTDFTRDSTGDAAELCQKPTDGVQDSSKDCSANNESEMRGLSKDVSDNKVSSHEEDTNILCNDNTSQEDLSGNKIEKESCIASTNIDTELLSANKDKAENINEVEKRSSTVPVPESKVSPQITSTDGGKLSKEKDKPEECAISETYSDPKDSQKDGSTNQSIDSKERGRLIIESLARHLSFDKLPEGDTASEGTASQEDDLFDNESDELSSSYSRDKLCDDVLSSCSKEKIDDEKPEQLGKTEPVVSNAGVKASSSSVIAEKDMEVEKLNSDKDQVDGQNLPDSGVSSLSSATLDIGGNEFNKANTADESKQRISRVSFSSHPDTNEVCSDLREKAIVNSRYLSPTKELPPIPAKQKRELMLSPTIRGINIDPACRPHNKRHSLPSRIPSSSLINALDLHVSSRGDQQTKPFHTSPRSARMRLNFRPARHRSISLPSLADGEHSDMSRHTDHHKRLSLWSGTSSGPVHQDCGVNLGQNQNFFPSCPIVDMLQKQRDLKELNAYQAEKLKREESQLKTETIYARAKSAFAESMGLMRKSEFEDSPYSKCRETKLPESWKNYHNNWFGKRGTVDVVCSICKRHFSSWHLCLRHHRKKHPHIIPNSLELEKGNYVDDMYYYYPMKYGILAETSPIPENLTQPEVFVCTRCHFPYRNLNRLHAHMIVCNPSLEEWHRPQVARSKPQPVVDSKANLEPAQPADVKPKLGRPFKYPSVLQQSTSTTQATARSTGPSQSSQPFSFYQTGRKRKNYELLYNPRNHVRRRELYQVLDTHQCNGCKLKFKSISMLERHVKKCSGRDRVQSQKPLLSGIMPDDATVRKQHTCRYCNKRFTYIKGVDLHYKRICSVRKLKEEEGKLTGEDFAHEDELRRIIEHMKWSKTFNKDSSDIIQGKVRVEEDGTLTRLNKRKASPVLARRVKKRKVKNQKWSYSKSHNHANKSSSPSEQNSPVGSSISPKLGRARGTSNEINPGPIKSYVGFQQKRSPSSDDSLLKKFSSFPLPEVRLTPLPSPVETSTLADMDLAADKPVGKRGRPRKYPIGDPRSRSKFRPEQRTDKASTPPVTHSVLEDSPNLNTNKTDAPAGVTVGKASTQVCTGKTNTNIAEEPDTAHRLQRKRGRPKKLDPSDMESTYKKTRLGDPDFVAKNASRGSSQSGSRSSSSTDLSPTSSTRTTRVKLSTSVVRDDFVYELPSVTRRNRAKSALSPQTLKREEVKSSKQHSSKVNSKSKDGLDMVGKRKELKEEAKVEEEHFRQKNSRRQERKHKDETPLRSNETKQTGKKEPMKSNNVGEKLTASPVKPPVSSTELFKHLTDFGLPRSKDKPSDTDNQKESSIISRISPSNKSQKGTASISYLPNGSCSTVSGINKNNSNASNASTMKSSPNVSLLAEQDSSSKAKDNPETAVGMTKTQANKSSVTPPVRRDSTTSKSNIAQGLKSPAVYLQSSEVKDRGNNSSASVHRTPSQKDQDEFADSDSSTPSRNNVNYRKNSPGFTVEEKGESESAQDDGDVTICTLSPNRTNVITCGTARNNNNTPTAADLKSDIGFTKIIVTGPPTKKQQPIDKTLAEKCKNLENQSDGAENSCKTSNDKEQPKQVNSINKFEQDLSTRFEKEIKVLGGKRTVVIVQTNKAKGNANHDKAVHNASHSKPSQHSAIESLLMSPTTAAKQTSTLTSEGSKEAVIKIVPSKKIESTQHSPSYNVRNATLDGPLKVIETPLSVKSPPLRSPNSNVLDLGKQPNIKSPLPSPVLNGSSTINRSPSANSSPSVTQSSPFGGKIVSVLPPKTTTATNSTTPVLRQQPRPRPRPGIDTPMTHIQIQGGIITHNSISPEPSTPSPPRDGTSLLQHTPTHEANPPQTQTGSATLNGVGSLPNFVLSPSSSVGGVTRPQPCPPYKVLVQSGDKLLPQPVHQTKPAPRPIVHRFPLPPRPTGQTILTQNPSTQTILYPLAPTVPSFVATSSTPTPIIRTMAKPNNATGKTSVIIVPPHNRGHGQKTKIILSNQAKKQQMLINPQLSQTSHQHKPISTLVHSKDKASQHISTTLKGPQVITTSFIAAVPTGPQAKSQYSNIPGPQPVTVTPNTSLSVPQASPQCLTLTGPQIVPAPRNTLVVDPPVLPQQQSSPELELPTQQIMVTLEDGSVAMLDADSLANLLTSSAEDAGSQDTSILDENSVGMELAAVQAGNDEDNVIGTTIHLEESVDPVIQLEDPFAPMVHLEETIGTTIHLDEIPMRRPVDPRTLMVSMEEIQPSQQVLPTTTSSQVLWEGFPDLSS